MAYIGKDLPGILNHNKLFETFTGDGIITSKVLSRTPGSVNNVDVFYDGAFQTPGVDFTLSGNTITFTSAPPNGVVVSILAGEDSQVITPEENTVTSAKITNNTITNALLPSTIPSTKLSGSALPAIDGSNLLNVSTGLLSGSSDPTITQNPAGGVGTVYTNTSSGEVFVLTDATTDANVWVNVGSGVGDVYTYQGHQYGYVSSGDQFSTIQRFSFASGTQNATDTNKDLSTETSYTTGVSSALHGYIAGGGDSLGSAVSAIQRFDFASDANAENVGNLVTATQNNVAVNSNDYGYSMGGRHLSGRTNILEKYSFNSQNNATDIGDLLTTYENGAGHANKTHGYASAGNDPDLSVNIFKITFPSDALANYNGDLTTGKERRYASGVSSTENGYTAGGRGPSNVEVDIIDKFNFASEANSTNIGTFSARSVNIPSSSTTHGYWAGGGHFSTGKTTLIEKVDFSSDGSAVSVGNLAGTAFLAGTGHQV